MIGISGETALGAVVQIRAETDAKRIREMTAQEKKIRQEWNEFRNKQDNKINNEQKIKQVQEMLKSMFSRR